jgi:hypothetical protein
MSGVLVRGAARGAGGFGVELRSTVNVTGSLALEVIRLDVVEKHWPWLLMLFVGTAASAVTWARGAA